MKQPYDIQLTPEYAEIKKFYGERKAARSQVPLMRHIHEGLAVIQHLQLSDFEYQDGQVDLMAAQRAYCLHPMLQSSEMLEEHGVRLATCGISALSILLAMEYRARANAWLSDKVFTKDGSIQTTGQPDAGPIPEVWVMLIADKVQNYKDFLKYQKDHERYGELDVYFKMWMQHLEIDPTMFGNMVDIMEKVDD